MNTKQEAALKKLGDAFLECKKAGLVFAGVDSSLLATVKSQEFEKLRKSTSTVEAMLDSENHAVTTHGAYMDSGGA